MVRKSVMFSFVLALLFQAGNAFGARYLLNLTATSKSTNAAGAIVTGKVSAPAILTEIFADAPAARLHTLVYDVDTGEVLVIQRATGDVLGAWYLFTVDTLVEDGRGNKADVYWTITCPADDGFRGTAVGTASFTREGETLTKFKMIGKFVLRYQGDTGNRVFSGVFSTGAQYVAP